VQTTKDQTVAADPSIDPTRWQQTLEELLGRIAGHFARVEPRRRAAAFVCGLLAELPRKNCWTLAEHAGDPTPDGMQHLLSGAVWDEHAVRDDVRDYVVEHLGDPQGVLVVDESGDCKKGTATVGVARQYTGTSGKVDNAQVAVYLAYASPVGYAVVDRELYVPRGWIADPDRRAAAEVPEQLGGTAELGPSSGRIAFRAPSARRRLADLPQRERGRRRRGPGGHRGADPLRRGELTAGAVPSS
jgi:SRSO17 transposase